MLPKKTSVTGLFGLNLFFMYCSNRFYICACLLIGRQYMDVYAPVIAEEDDELVTTAHYLNLPEIPE